MEKTIEQRAKEIGDAPAFPTSSLEGAFGSKGLTKLEWFMGMAMQGLVGDTANRLNFEPNAKHAYSYAVEMCAILAEMEVANGK